MEMMDMAADDTREELRRKLRSNFDGRIVRKDLTKKIKEGANVPVYVLEFLLGQYCSSDDETIIEQGVQNVKRILADNFVRPDEAQKILSQLRKNGSHTIIDMYFDAKEFGKRLHDVRTSRGITQEELAVRLGLASKQHVSRMENGERSCSIDLLIELSCILHVSTDYLLMGSEPSKEEVKNDLLSIISELSTIAKKI